MLPITAPPGTTVSRGTVQLPTCAAVAPEQLGFKGATCPTRVVCLLPAMRLQLRSAIVRLGKVANGLKLEMAAVQTTTKQSGT